MTEGIMYEEEQVVWAKIRGYPWWPGVVSKVDKAKLPQLSDDIQFTVKFIGENTHASLASKYINDFETYYSQHSKLKGKVGTNKWLLKCVSIAKQLSEGELDVSNLSNINANLLKKKHRTKDAKSSDPIVEPPKESNLKLEKLKQLLEEKIHTTSELHTKVKSRKTSNSLARHEKLLSEFTEDMSGEETKVSEICESLYELTKMDVTAKLLAKNPIKRLVKLLANLCKQSSCEALKEIAEVAQRLREYWKKIGDQGSVVVIAEPPRVIKRATDESYIADKSLRRKVCCKIAKVLENNKFGIEKAQELALSIERNLRTKDPSMSSRYRNYFRYMIRDIKNISPVAYQAAKEDH